MVDSYDKEVGFALEAVRKATRLCQRIQHELVLSPISKPDRSPVTVADFASQAVVAHLFDQTFLEDVLVAEEDSKLLRDASSEKLLDMVTAHVEAIFPEVTPERVCQWIDRGAGQPVERFWTLDPIDGTKGFLRGDQYVVALALIVEGQIVLGAMGCPRLNHHLSPTSVGEGMALIAVRDQGAWAQGLEGGTSRRVYVSSCSEESCARMLCSYESAHTDPEKIEALVKAMSLNQPPIRIDSQVKYALVSGGQGELIFRLLSPSRPGYCERIWDHAAGSIIVEEAGGRVTDLRGEPLDFGVGRTLKKNRGILVSNKLLHEIALDAIRIVDANRRPESW